MFQSLLFMFGIVASFFLRICPFTSYKEREHKICVMIISISKINFSKTNHKINIILTEIQGEKLCGGKGGQYQYVNINLTYRLMLTKYVQNRFFIIAFEFVPVDFNHHVYTYFELFSSHQYRIKYTNNFF